MYPPAIPPDARRVASALGGFVLFAAAGALGADAWPEVFRVVPTAALAASVPLILTAPALLVVHQLFGLQASPQALLTAMLDAFVGCGRVALGLAPALLFFSMTSGLGLPLYIGCGGLLLATGLFRASRGLKEADAAATDIDTGELRARRALLAAGWMVLTGLITLRVGFALLDFALS